MSWFKHKLKEPSTIGACIALLLFVFSSTVRDNILHSELFTNALIMYLIAHLFVVKESKQDNDKKEDE